MQIYPRWWLKAIPKTIGSNIVSKMKAHRQQMAQDTTQFLPVLNCANCPNIRSRALQMYSQRKGATNGHSSRAVASYDLGF